MKGLASEYQKLAELWQTIDYSDPKSVEKCNRASERMRQIVLEAEETGTTAIESLTPLLDDPVAGRWLAHHLLMFAWIMTRPVNLFGPFTGLPFVGLDSFAVQTSIVELATINSSTEERCFDIVDDLATSLEREGNGAGDPCTFAIGR